MTRTDSAIRFLRFTPAACLVLAGACASPANRARTIQDNEGLRRENRRLERTIAERDANIAQLESQVGHLRTADPKRPPDLFAPVRIEFVKLSGGADYNDKPGDDGVTVYLRPRDADGDVVKAPGRITVQMVDNANPETPRVIGVCRFEDPAELRKLWHGRFGTSHYTLKCPFPPGTMLPASRKLIVFTEFVDYLTGRTMSAVEEMSFSEPSS